MSKIIEFTPTKNGVEREMTAEEQAVKDNDIANADADEQARIDLITNQENFKASGNQKLLDLGLTQAEATALTGYTIPVVPEENEE